MYGSLPRGLEGHSGLRESCAKADVIECSGNDKKKQKTKWCGQNVECVLWGEAVRGDHRSIIG